MKSFFGITAILVLVTVYCLPLLAAAQDAEKTTGKYQVAVTGSVQKVQKLGEYSYLVVIDKGKVDGVKERRMSLRYYLKTADSQFGLVVPMAPLDPLKVDAQRFKRPFVTYVKSRPEVTVILFWTYHDQIVQMKENAKKAGTQFNYAHPQVGDIVQFVEEKK